MSKFRKYGPDIRAQIVAAYNTDEKTEAIRQRFGVPHCTMLRFVKEAGERMRIQRNKRQQIIKLSENNPRLGPTAIAREVGADKKYVQRIRKECGFKTIRKVNHVAPVGTAIPNQGGPQGIGT